MMKQIRIICSVVVLIGSLSCTSTVYAQSLTMHLEPHLSDIQTRADVIEKKYRVYDGHYQYRHWNVTQGCWVEDHWINIT
ncbi:hypothetical protein SAMN04487884_10991 [Butyrivibrio fibrisolvens]|uniref:Uncharacterized protein n=1 Tax=Butyrivibrio fibrisolvens TaxID=831 RepID=A0A1H9RAB2_BUTFI|nr:hypothetical protein SAMN04487884_10991 [Butyrivibrio fibrisolvens]